MVGGGDGGGGGFGGEGGGDGGGGVVGGDGGDGRMSAQLTRVAHPEELSDILICATLPNLLQNAAPTVGPDVTV